MARRYQSRLERAPTSWVLIGIPVVSVMLGSLVTLLPQLATAPTMPPFGLMVLLGWRMLVRDLWPAWIGVPLGLFDDLFSGQPLGSAACIWTILLLLMELFDRRMMWRDYKQDWIIASSMIAGALVIGFMFANMGGAGGSSLLLMGPQILLSALCMPLVVRFCSGLDRLRWDI